ncbi:MAG: hypothetical protein KC591_02200, partial [Gemmatimonadetes bacterium]|nr:hypothetical protein [Gemmatimonadota bacterium]
MFAVVTLWSCAPIETTATELQSHPIRMRPAATGRVAELSSVVDAVFSEDFESGLGAWTVVDSSGAGAEWGISDCWSVSGVSSAACAAAGSNAISCGEDYPDGMKTWLIAGPFDLSDPNLTGAAWEFTYEMNLEPNLDRFFAGISTDGVDFYGEFREENGSETIIWDLADYLGESSVWVAFEFVSDASVARPDGVAVDDEQRAHRRQDLVVEGRRVVEGGARQPAGGGGGWGQEQRQSER